MTSLAGSGCEIFIPENELKSLKEIEKSVIKKYNLTFLKFGRDNLNKERRNDKIYIYRF